MLKHHDIDLTDSFEKIPVKIYHTPTEGSKYVAGVIADCIREKQQNNEPIVLGLATGSTPISMYKELVRLHREEGLSFKNVITFNLDEYYPLAQEAMQSYRRYMKENLFNHIDIAPENCNIPDATE